MVETIQEKLEEGINTSLSWLENRVPNVYIILTTSLASDSL